MSELAVVENSDQVNIDKVQLVTMVIEDQMFGVPILQVRDIVEPRLITPVPLAPSAIAGVMNLRGQIVTVINLRRCLGLDAKPDENRGMGITVEYHGDLYSLLVDSIGDVRDLARRDYEKPPATLGEKLRRLSTGVYRLPDDLLVVLDFERILDTDILTQTPPVVLTRREPAAERAAKEKTKLIKSDHLIKRETKDTTEAGAAPLKARAKRDEDNVVKFPEAGSADRPAETVTAKESLFERLGGDAAVEAAVDNFYAKIMADASLRPFFAGVDMDRQSFMRRIFLTAAVGGPQGYSGKSLRAAHKPLAEEKGLGEAHFAAVAVHLQATLEELNVPVAEIQEVMTIAASTHDDVSNL